MRLLVTGAGRCGSWWMTKALKSCGIDAQHEVAFSLHRHGEGEWECEVSWMAAPYTPVKAHTVTLVRHPLRQIASRAAWGSFEPGDPPKFYDPRRKGAWAMGHLPAIRDGATPIERAAIHWVEWHRLILGEAEVLRIEDVTADDVHRLASIVNEDARPPTLPERRNINKAWRDVPEVGWDQVAHVPGLVDLAGRFGYDTKETTCDT